MRKTWLSALLVAALTGCASQVGEPTSYQLVEFAVEGPGRLGSGAGTITVDNAGEFPHTLVITDESGTVVAATSLIAPGETTSLAIDLDPGTYSVTCRIVAQTPDGDIVDHFEAGMHTTVEVAG
ncbi:MAG TPA: hypothetical protein VFT85_03200 [Acidimicrobiia bacterium]|nr:hypothetical protein [Acidimicrobiia bacterium]